MSAKKNLVKSAMIIGLLAMTACSDLDPQEERMLTGAAAGTTIGALGTFMFGGCVACGAAIGGAIGTGTGYIVDKFNPQPSQQASR